jgi:hypothetical protein
MAVSAPPSGAAQEFLRPFLECGQVLLKHDCLEADLL